MSPLMMSPGDCGGSCMTVRAECSAGLTGESGEWGLSLTNKQSDLRPASLLSLLTA